MELNDEQVQTVLVALNARMLEANGKLTELTLHDVTLGQYEREVRKAYWQRQYEDAARVYHSIRRQQLGVA